MSDYIWLDENGKEIARKLRTRGRPPLNAVQREDGNFYVPFSPENKSLPQNPSLPLVEEVPVVQSEKISLNDFLSCCFVSRGDFICDGPVVTLNRVVITGKTNLSRIPFNSVFSRIEIDRKNNVTKVWKVDPQNPSFQVQGLFSDLTIGD